jgi:recombinational DNA repair protein (RecF pathway)
MQLAARIPAFQLALMRKSAPPRHACAHCRRTPLVGELIHRYEGRLVCDLCRPRLRASPEASELMHSPEHDRAVRVRRLSG